MPPVNVFWYEGSMTKMFKAPHGLKPEDMRDVNEVFVGTKGFLGTSGRGESYSLLPRSRQLGHARPPEVLKRSPGHFQDWIRALKGGQPACSNFTISGPYTEWMLLGAISWRFPERETVVGRQEPAVHQQREGQRVRQAQLPQGLGTAGHQRVTCIRRAGTSP